MERGGSRTVSSGYFGLRFVNDGALASQRGSSGGALPVTEWTSGLLRDRRFSLTAGRVKSSIANASSRMAPNLVPGGCSSLCSSAITSQVTKVVFISSLMMENHGCLSGNLGQPKVDAL